MNRFLFPSHVVDYWRDYVVDNILLELGQVLRVMEYSQLNRHLLLTAGNDVTIHLWDTTALSPKAGQFCFRFYISFSTDSSTNCLFHLIEY